MPIGVLTNCASVLAGGVIGSALGHILPASLKEHLPTMFGLCSIAIGINSIIKASAMTPVVLALLVGFTIGHLLHLEQWTSRFFHKLVKAMHLGGDGIDMEFYITAVALFCCSGFGWYSTLTEGIAGDPSLLFSKAVLDGFTALIFASTLGKSICAIPLPQCVILLCVFGAGRLLAGVLTPTMFADLSACGGVLTMAAGFRVSKIKSVPLVDLMPALLLVMPFSLLWTMLMR
ncbi:DUF554 domain-containing protein [Agathobaculum sp.]|uniref:DUF554 domain-containing protein n=1 Tax=Agathobaculum sp. TaxID=2048138 RepID=UPI003AB913A6